MAKVFFSGNPCTQVCLVTFELKRLIGSAKGTAFFVPADNEDITGDFNEASVWMRDLGFKNVQLIQADRPLSKRTRRSIAHAPLVFIGGGNTFYLMKHLDQFGLGEVLPEVDRRGGVLAGQSAGAIVMTPTIHTAGFPEFDRDENAVRLRRMRGLNLVKFEFFPHFTNRPSYRESLCEYSKLRKVLVYGSDDNGGIVVTENRAIFIGNVWGFWGGQHTKICPV